MLWIPRVCFGSKNLTSPGFTLVQDSTSMVNCADRGVLAQHFGPGANTFAFVLTNVWACDHQVRR